MQGKRLWVTAIALAIGAGILLLAWVFSHSDDSAAKSSESKAPLQWSPPSPPSPPSSPSSPNSSFSGNAGKVNPAGELGGGGIKDYVLRGKTKRGEPVSVSGQTLDPLPQGRYKVVAPVCRVQLSDRRVFQLKARQGTIDAPQNLPRGGELSGQVEVSVFQSSGDRSPDLSDESPDLAMRLYLNDARFDLELEQMDSDGPVHMTSPRFDFKGKGLSMVYNGRRGRLERMEVFTGQVLRVATDGATSLSPSGRNASAISSSSSPSPSGTGPVSGENAGGGGKGGDRGEGGYYRARFMDQVKVDHNDLNLEGDVLSAIFSIGASQKQAEKEVESPPSKSPGKTGPGLVAASSNTPAKRPTGSPVFTPSQTDLRVTWTGRLLIEPEDQPSPDLAPADDVMLTLASRGSSVNIHTMRQESIQAPVVEYLLSRDRVAFRSAPSGQSSGGLVVLDAPQLGILQGQALIVDQKTGVGQVIGPGRLKGRESTIKSEPSLPSNGRLWTTGKGMPAGMSVAWKDTLDLTFFRSEKTNGSGRLTSIRSAHFRGQVKVVHPELDMASDEMFMELDSPVDGRQSLKTMNMAGQVRVKTLGVGRQSPLAVACDRLNLATRTGPKQQMIPTGLLAQGHVDAKSAGQSVRCDELDVALTGGEELAESSQSNPLAVHRMIARGQVQATIDQPATKLTGRYLSIDVPNDQLELLGSGPDQPATLSQPQGTLTGPRLRMSQIRQTLEVDGAGTFAFLQVPSDKAGKKGDPVAVHVSWQKQMTFDYRQGQARFRERVVSGSQSVRDSGRLECDDLQLEFTPPPPPPPPSTPSPPSSSTGDRGPSLDQARQIKSMLADGQMRFMAQSWADHVNGQLASRMTIKGPQMRFDQTRQTIDVIGAGSMLFENPPSPPSPPSSPSSPPSGSAPDHPTGSLPSSSAKAAGVLGSGGLAFGSGQGQTLFTWTGSLAFNLLRHDIDLRRQVTMVHRPVGQSQVMQLDCDRLQADLEAVSAAASSNEMGGWLSGRTTGPKLRSATASGQVVLQAAPQQVRSDEMIYSAQDQTMLLRSGGSHQTEVYKDGQLQLSAVGMRWDLKRNYFEVIQPNAMPVPMR